MILSTDSTANLPQELIKNLSISVLPMNLCIDEEIVNLNCENSYNEFYSKMRNGARVTTTQTNEYEAEEYFKKLLESKEDILHISFSSGLSGSVETVKRVADKLNSTCKNKIAVIDSLNGGMGEGLLLIFAHNFMQQNLSFEQVVTNTQNYVEKCCSYFTVDHLKYLVRGGRISKFKAALGSVLKIKPIIKADKYGKLVCFKKSITRKSALKDLFKLVTKNICDTNYVFVGHTDCYEDAKKLSNMFENELKITPEIINITPVLGAHCGPDTIAVFFVGNTK